MLVGTLNMHMQSRLCDTQYFIQHMSGPGIIAHVFPSLLSQHIAGCFGDFWPATDDNIENMS